VGCEVCESVVRGVWCCGHRLREVFGERLRGKKDSIGTVPLEIYDGGTRVVSWWGFNRKVVSEMAAKMLTMVFLKRRVADKIRSMVFS
jgi:hypothetical protein